MDNYNKANNTDPLILKSTLTSTWGDSGSHYNRQTSGKRPHKSRANNKDLYGNGSAKNPVLPSKQPMVKGKTYHSARVTSLVSGVISANCGNVSPIISACNSGGKCDISGNKKPNRKGKRKERTYTQLDRKLGLDCEQPDRRINWSTVGIAHLLKDGPDNLENIGLKCLQDSYLTWNTARKLTADLPYTCVCKQKYFGFHAGCPLYTQLKLIMSNRLTLEDDIEPTPTKLVPPTPAPSLATSTCSTSLTVSNRFSSLNIVSEDLDSIVDHDTIPEACVRVVRPKESDVPKILGSDGPLARVMNRIANSIESTDDDIRLKPRWWKRPFEIDSVFRPKSFFNHHIGRLVKHKDQSKTDRITVPDRWIIAPLYIHLRKLSFEKYPDRATKLAHMTKLAAKWESETLYFKEHEDVQSINQYWATIQKVTDSKDTEFLLQPVSYGHERNRLLIWWRRHTPTF